MIKYTRYFILPAAIILLGSCSLFKKSTKNTPVKQEVQHEIQDEKTRFLFEDLFFNAEREKMLNNYNEALDYYNQALKVYPQCATCHYNMGELLETLGRQKQAYESFKQAVALEKKNLVYYLRLGQSAQNNQDYEAAAAAFREAEKLNPGNPDHYFEEANQYIYLKDYDKALKIYDKMEKRFGIGEELIRQKEQIYLMQNKPDKAIKEVMKLVKESPYEPRYLGLLAELYMQTGQLDKAASTYQKMLVSEPQNGFAYFGLAEYYRQKNNRDSMIHSLNKAFEDPRISVKDKLNVVYSLIPMIEKDPRIKKPVFDLTETIRNTHPDEPQPFIVLGDLHYADGQPNLALKRYKRAIELDPNDFKVWRQVMGLQEALGDYKDLLMQSEEAMEFFPNQLIVYYYNASAKLVEGDAKGAAEVAGMGLALSIPDDRLNAALHSMQGNAYHTLGQLDKCFEAYDRSLELDPENEMVLNNYAYYLAESGKELDKALEMSRKTLQRNPNSATYLDTYGWVLFKKGEYEEAKKYIIRALAIDEENAELMEHLGDILYKLDNKKEAIDFWEKALKLNPDSKKLKKKVAGQVNL